VGLDVYLFKYNISLKEAQERETKMNQEIDECWAGVKTSTTEEKRKANELKAEEKSKKIRQKYGADEDYNFKDIITVNEPSKIFPEHYFKIGYFRSSYNGSGINRVLSNLGLGDLYTIFPHANDNYAFQPNWSESLALAKKVLKEFKAAPKYCVGHEFTIDRVNSPEEAMRVFRSEQESYKNLKSKYNYSNRRGSFFLESPLSVRGIIPGDKGSVYIVTEMDKEGIEYCEEALAIVIETIEYVINSGEASKFYLHWSS
jgi:hypothetical protein